MVKYDNPHCVVTMFSGHLSSPHLVVYSFHGNMPFACVFTVACDADEHWCNRAYIVSFNIGIIEKIAHLYNILDILVFFVCILNFFLYILGTITPICYRVSPSDLVDVVKCWFITKIFK